MYSPTSTASADNFQAKNSKSDKNNFTYSKEEIEKRRNAVWRGEKLILETRYAEARVMHSIGYLGRYTTWLA